MWSEWECGQGGLREYILEHPARIMDRPSDRGAADYDIEICIVDLVVAIVSRLGLCHLLLLWLGILALMTVTDVAFAAVTGITSVQIGLICSPQVSH